MAAQAKFSIGQLVHHRLFDYRGVIVDVDAVFLGSEEWYEQVAKSKPPKDQPWYHVLVHGGRRLRASRAVPARPAGQAASARRC
jgi:heat shock protein HspQ